jgi:hypothetical protein
MDVAADDCRIREVLHFNPGDPIAMNVALLKISIPVLKREHPNITSMVDVALAEGGVSMVFNPNASQIIPSNLTILKGPLSVIAEEDPHILAVTNGTVSDSWIRQVLFNTQSSAH